MDRIFSTEELQLGKRLLTTNADGLYLDGVRINNFLTVYDLGLDQVTNNAQVKRSEMGVANGVATLTANGTLPQSQLSASVTLQGNQFNLSNQLLKLDSSGKIPALDGSLLTNLSKVQVGLTNVQNVDTTNASNISSGTLSVSRIPIFIGSGANHQAGLVPDPGASAGSTRFLNENGQWVVPIGGGGGSGNGSVLSIDVNGDNTVFNTSTGGPITSSGTLTLSLKTQLANYFFSGPTGGAAVPSWRKIVNSDLPISVTLQGNSFNGSNQLIKLTSTGRIPSSLLPSNEITYTNSSNGNIASVKDALDSLLYVPISVSYFNNNIGTVEIGTVVNSVYLNWAFNKSPSAISLDNGIGNLPANTTQYTHTSTFNSDRVYYLSVSDGIGSNYAATGIYFSHKRYWGINAASSLNNSQILSLGSEFSYNKNKTFTQDGNGEYIYYVYPSAWGFASFTVNGLPNTAWNLVVQNFTNSSGYTESFNVYRTNTVQNGSGITIGVS